MLEVEDERKTVLHDRHVALGARMAPFGGFVMPIQYTGILSEHEAARRQCALFDTCHMGEFRLSGPSALADLEALVSCDVGSLAVGQCRYGLLCNPYGGVIDDLLVYRLAEQRFMLVVNAGTQQDDFEWVLRHLSPGALAENVSDETGKVDVQGPASPPIMQRLMEEPIDGLRFYRFMSNRYRGQEVLISRTGYTGEMGFEFYGPTGLAGAFWDDCMDLGAVPAGLGARDTLRLEVGMPLYGHELRSDRNASASGFTRSIAPEKTFVGCDAIRDALATDERLVGICFDGRQAAREGNTVLDADGRAVGVVTSGSLAPSLGYAVALAYVKREVSGIGTGVIVQARRPMHGVVASLPFYTAGTARRALAGFLSTE